MVKRVAGSKECGKSGFFVSFLFANKQNYLSFILSEQDQSMVLKLQQTLETPGEPPEPPPQPQSFLFHTFGVGPENWHF